MGLTPGCSYYESRLAQSRLTFLYDKRRNTSSRKIKKILVKAGEAW